MFSLIQTIAASLGYVNLSPKVKNRAYTVVASVGNFYLLYVAYRFFMNGFTGRGSLFILAFLVIAYFCYLNFMYYFTDKKAKFDISPKIEKALHLRSKDPLSEQSAFHPVAGPGYIQTNGIFKDEKFLPASLEISVAQSENIQAVAKVLKEVGYLTTEYAGMSEKQIFTQTQKTGKEVPKLTEPIALPFFEMKQVGDQLLIRGGLNQMRSFELASVKTVGLLPVASALQKFDLFAATVVLTGGPARAAARHSSVEVSHPYSIDIRVAFKEKDKPVR